MKLKAAVVCIAFACCIILIPELLGAQPTGGGPGGGAPPVPITGIEWLLVAGGLLGARKLLMSRRKNR